MKRILFTCPFTGVNFEAMQNMDGSLIIANPITGENMRIGFNPQTNRYMVDKRFMSFVETVNSTEAAELLGVTRARISGIVKDDTIPHFMVNGKHLFLKSDILNYAENRTIGRPTKEG